MSADNDPRCYMRAWMAGDDSGAIWLDQPSIDQVLDALDRLVAAGHVLDRANWFPYLVGDLEQGEYWLRGNFVDASAAFSVRVPFAEARRVVDRLAAIDITVRRAIW